MTTWNARLTEARTAAKLSKSEFARQVNVSNPTVSDWESGEIKKLEADNLLKICEVLKIPPRWLQYGEGQMIQSYAGGDPKIEAVTRAMELLPEYKKDILVQTSTALAEYSKSEGNGTQ